MQTNFTFIYKQWSLLLFILVASFSLQAQQTEGLLSIPELPKGVIEEQLDVLVGRDTVTFRYISLTDSMAVFNLSKKLHVENYPLTVIPEQELSSYFKLVESLGTNLEECQQLEQNYNVMDGLNVLREKKLFELIELEKQRADIFKEAQDELKEENARLSDQLSLSTKIANKNLKGRLRKNLTLGILGSVAGFTTGILIGILAAK